MDKTLKQNAKQHSHLKSFFAQSQSVLLIYLMAAKAIVIVVGVGPDTGIQLRFWLASRTIMKV